MTKYFDWKNQIKKEELLEVKKILDNDGIIVFPTDTVYGIGGNGLSYKAVKKIFEIKNRPFNNPINLLVPTKEVIKNIAKSLNKIEEKIIDDNMPGATTLIVEKKEDVPDILTANLDTVGVRIPDNEIALRILEIVKYPLATSSANISGEDAGINFEEACRIFDGRVDAIIDGGPSEIGIPSKILRVDNGEIVILRR